MYDGCRYPRCSSLDHPNGWAVPSVAGNVSLWCSLSRVVGGPERSSSFRVSSEERESLQKLAREEQLAGVALFLSVRHEKGERERAHFPTVPRKLETGFGRWTTRGPRVVTLSKRTAREEAARCGRSPRKSRNRERGGRGDFEVRAELSLGVLTALQCFLSGLANNRSVIVSRYRFVVVVVLRRVWGALVRTPRSARRRSVFVSRVGRCARNAGNRINPVEAPCAVPANGDFVDADPLCDTGDEIRFDDIEARLRLRSFLSNNGTLVGIELLLELYCKGEP